MYTSITFRLAKRYAIRRGVPWYILSAKHGLLHSDNHIHHYDLRPVHLGVAGRREWVSMILRQLEQDRVFDCRKIEILTGADWMRDASRRKASNARDHRVGRSVAGHRRPRGRA
ncbi:DUF6884 domain-containing protein [Bradyrhizobium genosp. P]|uniref:DUF6884 domain-containing protein n=1 Tax=Bradyrhizobium genosp. P TaxID=83641 RepID=UPI003CED4309